MKKIIVYDGMDNDGKVGAFIASKYIENATMIPLSRGRTVMTAPIWENGEDTKKPLDISLLERADVTFIDIVLDLETMDNIYDISAGLRVFDHHEYYDREWMIHGGEDACATKLVDFFYRGWKESVLETGNWQVSTNELVEYVNDRDLFFKRLPGVDDVFLALQTATDAELEWAYSNGVSRLIEKGKELYRVHMDKVNAISPRVVKLDGHTVAYTENIEFGLISDVGNKVCRELDVEFYVNCNRLDDGTYAYGLRATNGSAVPVCKKFGGGGHPSGNAGGFQVKNKIKIEEV